MPTIHFYKIVCNSSGLVYVGSTTLAIERRLQKHVYDYIQYLENKYPFVTSFTIIEKNNYTIHLIDSVECVDRKQRDSIELLHILNENGINKYQPGRDKKQHYQDNKEKINERTKQHYQDNKEKIKEQKKQYYQDNKERITKKITCQCGIVYIRNGKTQHTRSKKHLNYLATL